MPRGLAVEDPETFREAMIDRNREEVGECVPVVRLEYDTVILVLGPLSSLDVPSRIDSCSIWLLGNGYIARDSLVVIDQCDSQEDLDEKC